MSFMRSLFPPGPLRDRTPLLSDNVGVPVALGAVFKRLSHYPVLKGLLLEEVLPAVGAAVIVVPAEAADAGHQYAACYEGERQPGEPGGNAEPPYDHGYAEKLEEVEQHHRLSRDLYGHGLLDSFLFYLLHLATSKANVSRGTGAVKA